MTKAIQTSDNNINKRLCLSGHTHPDIWKKKELKKKRKEKKNLQKYCNIDSIKHPYFQKILSFSSYDKRGKE